MSAQQHPARFTSEADYTLREYKATPYLDTDELPPKAREAVEREINAASESDRAGRLLLEYRADGCARLRATQYVGIVSLPDGPTIEIRPKAPDANLLEMLQYAEGVRAETIAEETTITPGRRFISALATLYEAELREVLQQGLTREYRMYSGAEEFIRGRLDVQRQLQRQGPQPTTFECDYDDLTRDTVLNQAILYATTVILRLVDDGQVGSALSRHEQVLQREISLRPVRPVELDAVELSRLSGHYEDLYRLTQLVLRSVYAEEFHAGSRSSFSLLMDMNEIFEGVVERGVREVTTGAQLTFKRQHSSDDLVWGGSRPIRIQPDVLVQGPEGVKFVGDAKWKVYTSESPEPSNEDIYQVISYQVAHEAPGVLFYPEQDEQLASVYEAKLGDSLTLVEVPTSSQWGRPYSHTVKEAIKVGISLS